ncbi:MAG TPA: TolC family protein, partial [Bacteroidia bacterium]|nr:TolC family protein [Bacteroidia bacterium]
MKTKAMQRKPERQKEMQAVILFSMLFLFSSTGIFAQVLSLDSVLVRIENNNPALLSFEKKTAAADAMAEGARALPPPKAGVMLDENPYDFGFGSRMVEFSVSQKFPSANSLNAKEDYLKSLSDIELKESEKIKNQLFAQAKARYFSRYVTERKIKTLNDNIGLMQNMIEISQKQMATGMGDLASIYKMKARLADTEIMLIVEENMVKAFTVEMNYLMGADLNQTFSLDTNNLVKDYRNENILAAREILESNRSDIQKMNSEINSMKLNRAMIATMSKPEFEFTAKHFLRTGNEAFYALEAMVMIPIAPWSAKGYKSEVKAMGLKVEAMEQDRQAMLNMASSMVNMLYLELMSKYSEVEKYREKVIPAYQKSFETNLLAYSQNTGEMMQVIL